MIHCAKDPDMQRMAKRQHARPVEASQGKSTIFPAICWKTAGMPAMSAVDAFPLPAFACRRKGSELCCMGTHTYSCWSLRQRPQSSALVVLLQEQPDHHCQG